MSDYILRFIQIWLILMLLTLLFSLLIMVSSKNIFKKAGKDPKLSYIPIYNLMILLDITGIPEYFFIMLLFPIVNLLMILVILYRLSIVYQTSLGFALGLIFLSVVFIPVLNFSKYTMVEEEKKVDDVKDEMMPLLTEKEYNELNKVEVEAPKVDNVFKSPIQNEPPAPVFKATPNQIKYKEIVLPEEKKEEIKRVEPVQVTDIYTNRFINTKVVEEDDSIEIVEL